MRVTWSAPARGDLLSQIRYVAERHPEAARRLRAALREAVAALADQPYRGRPGRVDGTRELVIAGLPYIVVYRVSGTRIEILRLLHSAQDWPPRSPAPSH